MKLNRFLEGVAAHATARPAAEKWLLAPSPRVGYQWLDAIARSGRPLLNVRLKTLANLAVEELASLTMDEKGLKYARPSRLDAIVALAFASLPKGGGAYLGALEPGLGLTRALRRVVRDLRLAGVASGDIDPAAFEAEAKGRDIRHLLASYEKLLGEGKLADYAVALRLAAERLRKDPSALRPQTTLMCPSDFLESLSRLERELWDAFPKERRVAIKVDKPAKDASTDALRLSWLSSPGDAPQPLNDGSASMFRAVGEANEVREVLRRCSTDNVPLDDVEILHTDSQTYPVLIHELMSAAQAEGADKPAATIAEGLPVRCFRPGRALLAYLEWARQDCPQMMLIRMLQDGLIEPQTNAPEGCGVKHLASALRSVPIGSGRDRYVQRIRAFADKKAAKDDDGVVAERDEAHATRLRALADLVEKLLRATPSPEDSPLAVLRSAEAFLKNRARAASSGDNNAKQRLLEFISEMADCLKSTGEIEGFDPREWLSGLAAELTVEGTGAKPGCLHVASLAAGGHSGRGHTFIVGMDDARFPGTGIQDPLLLDVERQTLDGALPTAGGQLAQKTDDLARLLARLRGRVAISHSCRSLEDDREAFASPAALSAFRILSGKADGDHADMARWLGPPASFAPASEDACLDQTDWWLWRLCEGTLPSNPEEAISGAYPHLGRGFHALRERASTDFTEYDGYVQDAGADLSPFLPDAPPISPSRLERFGKCPLDFFFRDVLGVKPLDDHAVKPGEWLDALERGTLMHEVFQRFMAALKSEGLLPRYPDDLERIYRILDESAEKAKAENPPPNEQVFRNEMAALRIMARVFVCEEAKHFSETGNEPEFFEVSVGLKSDGSDATEAPVPVQLPDGNRILVKGQIDRIDKVADGRYSVWDYKTGSTYGYDQNNATDKGRRVQNVLYRAMAEAFLRNKGRAGATVESFGYFFPSQKAWVARFSWEGEKLMQGLADVATLCGLMAAGCFPWGPEGDDVKYSDYRAAVGDPDEATKAAILKVCNLKNAMLKPFAELRGVVKGDAEDE